MRTHRGCAACQPRPAGFFAPNGSRFLHDSRVKHSHARAHARTHARAHAFTALIHLIHKILAILSAYTNEHYALILPACAASAAGVSPRGGLLPGQTSQWIAEMFHKSANEGAGSAGDGVCDSQSGANASLSLSLSLCVLCAYVCVYARMHTRARARTHTQCVCTQACTRARTHTHTHTFYMTGDSKSGSAASSSERSEIAAEDDAETKGALCNADVEGDRKNVGNVAESSGKVASEHREPQQADHKPETDREDICTYEHTCVDTYMHACMNTPEAKTGDSPGQPRRVIPGISEVIGIVRTRCLSSC